jgi:hypothetical protein
MMQLAEGYDHYMYHCWHHPCGRCDRHSNIYRSPSHVRFVVFVLPRASDLNFRFPD